jgi:hypothetical protein
VSNVAGPQREVFLAGRPVVDLHFYGLGAVGLYFGIVTYNGAASAGVTTAAAACGDPAALAGHWAAAWEELRAAVLAAEAAGTLGAAPGDELGCGDGRGWALVAGVAAAAASAAAAALGWAGGWWSLF